MLNNLIMHITDMLPAGVGSVFLIFFWSAALFTVVGVVTAFVAILNHVRGLITRGNGS